MKHLAHHVAAIAALALAGGAHAQAPKLAKIFTDHAVLQRDQPIAIWGTAAPAAKVTVSLAGSSATAVADAQGKWRVELPRMAAGGPHKLSATINGKSSTLKDILIGDVFLCSGQSNMEFPMRTATNAWGDVLGSANSQIRFANIQKDSQPAPLADLGKPTAWKVAAPDTTGEASAVCYHMARSLQKRYQVPVGFINASWGGTTIQGWIGGDSLGTLPDYREGVAAVRQLGANRAQALAAEAARQEEWWTRQDPQAQAQRAFIAPGFDDSRWPTIAAGGRWRDAGVADFKDFSGVAWFRTTVELSAAQAKQASHLLLGQVADSDTAWVNGVRVGGGATWWMGREYEVPAGVFKAGKNVVVLRVLGQEPGAGLVSGAGERAIKTRDGKRITLPNTWRYQLGTAARGWKVKASPWEVPTSYSTLYNGMIAPLTGLKFKAAAWYQGESNAGAPLEYRTLLPLLMANWRQAFGQPELPFLIAQLAAFGPVATKPVESGWAELREAQALTVRNDRHAGLGVTFDYGDRSDIHPTQKTIVGERLARAARAIVYGENVTPGGPEAIGVERSGADLVVRFKNVNGGLRTYSSNQAIAFEVCTDKECRFVPASVDGDRAILQGANGAGVKRVRYAWADSPFVNLYSADDLPVVPFQLDVNQ
jgi:sialate O-acetylesterase